MDSVLCDELLQEIFTRLSKSSSSSSSSVSLVSKRWLHLYRTSKTSLSLKLNPENSTIPSLSSLLSHYPFLSSLFLISSSFSDSSLNNTQTTAFNDHVLVIVSCFCSKLKSFSFLPCPVSPPSLVSLSKTCTFLTSLTISLSRPLFFSWVGSFSCLKDLSVYVSESDGISVAEGCYCKLVPGFWLIEELDAELELESLSLSGVGRDDCGAGWLWRSCKKLKKLKLKSCESLGDGGSFLSFVSCLKGLQEVELRTCRSIVDGVLSRLADFCDDLDSLLVYDGGSREALLQFMNNCRCRLGKLDLRLPLDLNNDHLSAVAVNFRGLSILRLQSCCLVTGEGLKAVGIALSLGLEELALVNCDVIERESGLLSTLGQNLRKLRKLDLSYNESLLDKEFTSMLASCNSLIELRLRGCKELTGVTMFTMFKSCKWLESVDIRHCCRIGTRAIEEFLINSHKLRCLQVEESKLSDAARTWAAHKFVEVVA